MKDKPTGEIVHGYGVGPKQWHTMITTPINTAGCTKIKWGLSVACPWAEQYVSPTKCETCPEGRAGSFEEHWTLCNYQSSKPTANPSIGDAPVREAGGQDGCHPFNWRSPDKEVRE